MIKPCHLGQLIVAQMKRTGTCSGDCCLLNAETILELQVLVGNSPL